MRVFYSWRHISASMVLASGLILSCVHAECLVYDLDVVRVRGTHPSAVFKPEADITFDVIIASVGQLDAPSGDVGVPGFTLKFYMSTDDIITINDSKIGEKGFQNVAIPAGTEQTFSSGLMDFPASFSTGPRYLGVILTSGTSGENGTECTSAELNALRNNNSGNDPRVITYFAAGSIRTVTDDDLPQSGSTGDPVNTRTGELILPPPPDLFLGGPLRLYFQRRYAPGLESTVRTGSALGHNWRHNFDWSALRRGNTTDVTTASGRLLQFVETSNTWSLANRTDLDYQMNEANGALHVFAPRSERAYTFSSSGRLDRVSDALGNALSIPYDATGRVSQVQDGLGRELNLVHDIQNRLVAVTDHAGRQIGFGYGGTTGHELTVVSNASGHTTHYTYDNRHPFPGQLTAETRPGGNTWRRGLRADGSEASFTTPMSNTVTYAADAMGRTKTVMATGITNAVIDDDVVGRVASGSDSLGRTASFVYGTGDALKSITLPGGIQAQFEWDVIGKVTNTIDPTGNIWAHQMDVGGRLQETTDPLGRTTQYTYDSRSRVRTASFASGSRTNTYNAHGHLVRRSYSDGTDLRVQRDMHDSIIGGTGLLLQRDVMGRVTNANGLAITYDAGDQIASIQYIPGKRVYYRYDPNGSLTSISNGLGDVVEFSFDADNRLNAVQRPNGTRTELTYSGARSLRRITEAPFGQTDLMHDALGRPANTTTTLRLPLSTNTLYQRSLFSVDAAHQLTGPGVTHDPLGHLMMTSDLNCTWNLASQLTGCNGEIYTYDALNHRTARDTGSAVHGYTWNPVLPLPAPAILSRDGTNVIFCVYTPAGSLVYVIDAVNDATFYYHFDHIGNTRFVTDTNGAVVGHCRYDPFGVELGRGGYIPAPFA